MKNRFWWCPLAITFVVIIFLSCKKDTSNIFPNTVTDYDGNVYHTLMIGSQTWMLENLISTHDRNGKAIINVTDSTLWPTLTSPAYCAYNNDPQDNIQNYGLLYNWYAASDTAIAPTGFHVATDSDWGTLVSYLGGDAVAGGKMKQADTVFWANPNISDTVSNSGFNALPCGIRFNDTTTYATFEYLTIGTFWWSSTEAGVGHPWFRYIFNDTTAIYKSDTLLNETAGLSIRCVKN